MTNGKFLTLIQMSEVKLVNDSISVFEFQRPESHGKKMAEKSLKLNMSRINLFEVNTNSLVNKPKVVHLKQPHWRVLGKDV